ncbi:protein of unknown function (plasmid) [Pararobbsia alpina]|uniref:hypothetical protein n=1 Tax=Pararobbsia alpina TaxID=621374 RepID=UPI0039A65CA2
MEYPVLVTVVQFADSEVFRCIAQGEFYADGGVRIARPFKFDDGHNAMADPRDIEFCELVLPDGSVRRDFYEVKPAPPVRRSPIEQLAQRLRPAAGHAARLSLAISLCYADLGFGPSAAGADIPQVHVHRSAAQSYVEPERGALAVLGALALAFDHPRP